MVCWWSDIFSVVFLRERGGEEDDDMLWIFFKNN